ncbi:MAG: glycosyltransferase family 10 [Cyanobacteria bacterium J06560_5]
MNNTPFSGKNEAANRFLLEQLIEFTTAIKRSNILIARQHPGKRKLATMKLRYGNARPLLIWTHEPRFDTSFQYKTSATLLHPSIHHMNIYTGKVNLDNYYYFRNSYKPIANIQSISPNRASNKPVVLLATYIKNPVTSSLKKSGRELDLSKLRQEIGIVGHERNSVDIYGKGWPKGVNIDESRGKGWTEKKIDILKNYKFNLCMENTNYPYYCTEKIWQSILGGCLPIYYGKGNKIYEDFPKDSFIDASRFNSIHSMYDSIESMKNSEYLDRLNLCIDSYNRLARSEIVGKSFLKRMKNITDCITQIKQSAV